MVPGGAAGSLCAESAVATLSLPAGVTPFRIDRLVVDAFVPHVLTLYSRQGCCLCEGLEQRLHALDLSALQPPLALQVVDIDAPGVDPGLRARFDLEVPVLALNSSPLPRVSPRLSGEGLFSWLQRVCASASGTV